MKSIDVICPVFQEEEVIESFHEKLVEALGKLSARYRIRIVYVLDPSPDRTEAKLFELSKQDSRIEILVMSRRFGHQAALMAGMDRSAADAVVMLTDHDAFDAADISSHARYVLDCRNVLTGANVETL